MILNEIFQKEIMLNKQSEEKENPEIMGTRKESHLNLAFESQNDQIDHRFYYEPMLSGHPDKNATWETKIGDQTQKYPIWISSMTGGTSNADDINKKLAHTAKKFGFGMGLGSCRLALADNSLTDGFNLRPILGDEIPFYVNLGIAQVEQLLEEGEAYKIKNLKEKLSADGLIVHVNPLQEWLQPEGDVIRYSPLETIKKLLNEISFPIIVKEVGQGFGKQSMEELLKLPLTAIEFAANGGTNFSKLELFRNAGISDFYKEIVTLGHSAAEMVDLMNEVVKETGKDIKVKTVIVSGGIKSFLDGYYAISKSALPAMYGQAATFLKYANQSQEVLDNFAWHQIQGLLLAKAFLKVK
jgi:isopentenyl-diphosphate delta-isomerase